MKRNKYLIFLGLIFFFGILLRFLYIYPDNIIFGYDQVGNLISVSKIVKHHDIIIRALQPGELGLNHGVLFNYFETIPYFIGGGNPMVVAYWYSFLNCISIVSVFICSNYLFKNWFAALLSSFFVAVSSNMVLMAGWISNTTAALFLIPFYILGLLLYKDGRNWGFILSSFLLGLLIQSQMLMVYNICALPIIWVVCGFKWPSFKTMALSLMAFLFAVSTMIAAEVQSGFSSLKVLLSPSQILNESSLPFFEKLLLFGRGLLSGFYSNLLPQSFVLGMAVGLIILLTIFVFVFYKKIKVREKYGLIILLVILFSPAFMLIIGYHDTPWTLMGTIPLIFMLTGYTVSKIKSLPIKIIFVGLIFIANITVVIDGHKEGRLFIKQEASSILKGQLAVVDYTYQEAKGKPFSVNAVTYPLYSNTYWSYHYPWYGLKKYGYLPNWSGGIQVYPFDTLPMSDGKEQVYFMIVDETKAIPSWDKIAGKEWGQQFGKLVEEKSIGGFTVQKFVKLGKITI